MALTAQNHYAIPARNGVRLLHLDRDVATGCDDDLFITLWRERTTIEGVRIVARTFTEYAEDRARDVALLTVIERQAKMPSPGSREPLAGFLRDAGSNVLISGVAFEGDGFIAASIRGVVVGLTMIAHQPYPHRVFKDIVESSRWIESERTSIGKHFDAKRLQRFASAFRDMVKDRSRY